jgi:hypothetical protein
MQSSKTSLFHMKIYIMVWRNPLIITLSRSARDTGSIISNTHYGTTSRSSNEGKRGPIRFRCITWRPVVKLTLSPKSMVGVRVPRRDR